MFKTSKGKLLFLQLSKVGARDTTFILYLLFTSGAVRESRSILVSVIQGILLVTYSVKKKSSIQSLLHTNIKDNYSLTF